MEEIIGNVLVLLAEQKFHLYWRHDLMEGWSCKSNSKINLKSSSKLWGKKHKEHYKLKNHKYKAGSK